MIRNNLFISVGLISKISNKIQKRLPSFRNTITGGRFDFGKTLNKLFCTAS